MSTAKFDTIGQYLLKRLYDAGVKHIFGVPGDYVLGFYDLMIKSPIQHIGTTREDTAAFAADGYARCTGMGALAVTYGVGALKYGKCNCRCLCGVLACGSHQRSSWRARTKR